MTKPHSIDYYPDGITRVAYCKICSAEGLELLEDCPKEIINSYSLDQKRIAGYMGLHADLIETWPIDIIDRLIRLEQRKGHSRLIEEIRKLVVKSS